MIDAWLQHPTLRHSDALALPPEVQADFLDGNARRVFNL